MNPTVFIIDDEPEMRNSLKWLMDSVKLNTELYDSGKSFLENYDRNRLGCVLIDVRMPDISGLELLDILNDRKSRLPTIIITGHGDVPMAVRAMKSGAKDFILKPFNSQMLIEQIQRQIAKTYDKVKPHQSAKIAEDFATLTVRELEIFELIVAGKINKEIATELNIAVSTVEYHRASLMKKIHVKNVAQLLQMKLALDTF